MKLLQNTSYLHGCFLLCFRARGEACHGSGAPTDAPITRAWASAAGTSTAAVSSRPHRLQPPQLEIAHVDVAELLVEPDRRSVGVDHLEQALAHAPRAGRVVHRPHQQLADAAPALVRDDAHAADPAGRLAHAEVDEPDRPAPRRAAPRATPRGRSRTAPPCGRTSARRSPSAARTPRTRR